MKVETLLYFSNMSSQNSESLGRLFRIEIPGGEGILEKICDRMGWLDLWLPLPSSGDGQTEVLNQSLEISLRAYVGPSRDDWASYLDALALSYNSTPHTATGYAPAYLLRGYTPVTGSTILHSPNAINRPSKGLLKPNYVAVLFWRMSMRV